jgi:hypothetical protein
MYAILCDATGQRMCGSDGIVPVDGRMTIAGKLNTARACRIRFRMHFPNTYNHWSHCFFVPSIQSWDGRQGKKMYTL